MKFLSAALLLIFVGLCNQTAFAQPWVEKMQDRSVNFYDVQQDFNAIWANKPYKRGNGWKQFKRWENFWEPRVFPHGIRPTHNHVWLEHLRFQRTYPQTSASSRSANWTPMGPYSWTNSAYNPGMGRVNAVAEDPNNSNVLYAGAPSGGCWKSTDGGNSWAILTDDFQTLGVSAIAIDYTNSNIIYLGTGDDDAGDTYSIGLFKTSDGGSTWQEITPNSSAVFGTHIFKIIIHPTNHNTIFVASSTGCHKSIDGGNTWTLLQGGSWRDMELKPTDPNTIYICNKTFLRSTNGGTTWTQISTGLPAVLDINRAEIAVSPANPNYVYFLCGEANTSSFYGLYRSDNSGVSFNLQANSPNIFSYDMAGADTDGQSWYDMALAVSATNAEEVYTGGINVWKSVDGGVTFTIKSHWVYPPTVAYTHADIHTLEVFGNNLYCGSDGGLFKSTNGGNLFANKSFGLAITQFYRIGGSERAPNKIVGGTQDNGCNLISNGNARHIAGGDGMESLISPHDTLVIYTSSQNGGFQRSDDGGYTFSTIFPTENGNGAWVTPMVINPNDNDMLLTGFDQVYSTYDKGNSDQVVSNFNLGGDLLRNLAISPSDGYSHFYAGTYNQIFATADGGFSWTEISAGLPNAAMTSITVHPTNPLKVWVTFSGTFPGEKVYVSENGGATWTNISSNLPNLPINCLVYQNGSADGIYIGTDVGVYYTDTLLAGWQQFMDGLPNVIVNDFEINYTLGKLRAGTYGRGIWQSNLKAPLTNVPDANFAYSNSHICPTDSIQFTDTSIDHAPGWTWHFPGGSPSSSTLRHPKVTYSATGIYNVTLIVQNINGIDSITKTIPVVYQPNSLNFDIQMDNSSIDVAWNLKDTAGTTLYNSPLFALNGQNNQLVQRAVCLPAGCYTLVMIDVASNGLCCGNGAGYYLLTDMNGDTLAFGSNYGNTDSTTFCVNQTLPIAAGSAVTHAACGLNNGSIEISAIGGAGNYQYSIDNGTTFQSGNIFNNLAAGTYTIVVQDGLGAQATNSAVIATVGIPVALASVSNSTVYLNQGGLTNFFSTGSSSAVGYLWKFPNGSTSTQANPSFTFTTDGVQQVILTAINGTCSDSDTLDITVVNNVSIDLVQNDANIQIIPNPIKDKFALEISFLQEQENVEIVIHNALGQRVFWQELQGVKNHTQQIHLGNEASGIYILTVLSQNTAISRKIVKE